jgi:hypothetical protein
LPTAYHEKTTPYADYPITEFDDTFDVFGIDFEDDDFSEVIEAINPNVKVKYVKSFIMIDLMIKFFI